MQTATPPSNRKPVPPRGKAFSDAECVAITKAMMCAKNNPTKGDGSKYDDFLQHFRKYFDNLQLDHWPERNTSALAEKYSNIRRDCHRFLSYLGLVEKEPPKSGATRSQQSNVEKATHDFLKKERKPFLFYSCVPYFRDQPSSGLKKPAKWQPSTPLGGAARPSHSPSFSPSNIMSTTTTTQSDDDCDDLFNSSTLDSSGIFHESEMMFSNTRACYAEVQNPFRVMEELIGQHHDSRQPQQGQLHQQQQVSQQLLQPHQPASNQHQFQSPLTQRQRQQDLSEEQIAQQQQHDQPLHLDNSQQQQDQRH